VQVTTVSRCVESCLYLTPLVRPADRGTYFFSQIMRYGKDIRRKTGLKVTYLVRSIKRFNFGSVNSEEVIRTCSYVSIALQYELYLQVGSFENVSTI
jgi:hypothetical protein